VTNVVKNGVEAIQQKRDEGEGGPPDRIAVTVSEANGKLRIDVHDSGIGLPADRGRLTEPYMTTRAKGTGLGLAIVKKIVEEHFGQIEFDDAPGGGSLVRFTFDVDALRRLAADGAPQIQEASG
jgi:two-component system nitrogen regulation sensor histidine kinase NtrY